MPANCLHRIFAHGPIHAERIKAARNSARTGRSDCTRVATATARAAAIHADTAADRTRRLGPAVLHVVCRDTCRHHSAEEYAPTTHLTFAYRSVYLRHAGSDYELDANAIQVTIGGRTAEVCCTECTDNYAKRRHRRGERECPVSQPAAVLRGTWHAQRPMSHQHAAPRWPLLRRAPLFDTRSGNKGQGAGVKGRKQGRKRTLGNALRNIVQDVGSSMGFDRHRIEFLWSNRVAQRT